MQVQRQMRQLHAAVWGEGRHHIIRRADREGLAAMTDPGDIAELADRRQITELTRRRAAGPRVAVGAVEIEHLMEPGLDVVPGLFARRCDMDAQRHRSDRQRPRIVAVGAQGFEVFVMAAPGAGSNKSLGTFEAFSHPVAPSL